MPFSALRETLLTFSRAAKLLPPLRGDSPVSPCTLWRWSRYGVRSPAGRLIKLQTWRIGGRACTSREALERFLRELNPGTSPEPLPVEAEAVERALDRLGI
jgi:hypothetical protein